MIILITKKRKDKRVERKVEAKRVNGFQAAYNDRSSKVWDINDPHATLIHKLVGKMIATDNQPFSVVHDTGFNCLIKKLEPRYALPSQNIS